MYIDIASKHLWHVADGWEFYRQISEENLCEEENSSDKCTKKHITFI